MELNTLTVKGMKVRDLLRKDKETEKEIAYNIPKYQREYVWGKSEWEAMFDDILENSNGYFLGTIITIQDNSMTSNSRIISYEIIDGQQRLTTISILILALYKILSNNKTDLTDDQLSYLNKLKKHLLLKNSKLRLQLQTQGNNFADYQNLLKDKGILSSAAKSSYATIRRIYKAYNYFETRISSLINKSDKVDNLTENKTNITELFNFIEKLRSAIIVRIKVNNRSDAYTLFESLNNRGRPLTPIDLIKNQFLSKISNKSDNLDDYFNQWKNVIENLGDEYTSQERFFRQNFNAFRKAITNKCEKINPKTIATKANLIPIYENLVENDPNNFIKEILENSNLYAPRILNSNETNSNIRPHLENLQYISGSPSYIILLYILKKQKILKLTDEQIIQIIDFLINFFVRRNLTDTPATRDLTRLFISISEEIETKKITDQQVVDYIKAKLKSVSASDEVFSNKLHGPIFEENSGVTRFILCSIENNMHNPRETFNLWEKTQNDQFKWTIEHVFPQGLNIPDCWIQEIANGNKEKAVELQQIYVHQLGNLTLSAYNSKLFNYSFQDKKNKKDKDNKPIGYLNGLGLNEYISKQEFWHKEQIIERTEKLCKIVLDLFKL